MLFTHLLVVNILRIRLSVTWLLLLAVLQKHTIVDRVVFELVAHVSNVVQVLLLVLAGRVKAHHLASF
jgi:hypothetical protein